MGLLLQISDPHFGTEQPHVVVALQALAARERPTVLVWSGDITQRARASQFLAARQFNETLGIPHVLAIPGNHDIPLFNLAARAFNPYGGFMRAFGPELEPTVSLPGLQVICVNTTRRWRHKDGEVSSQQIERVAAQLAQAVPDQLRIVVVHQPVWVTQAHDQANLLHGHQQALSMWGAAGADIIMGGHIHLPYVKELLVQSGEVQRPLWVVQAGTALSSRVRGGIPNSVNLIRYPSTHGVIRRALGSIDRWDFNARHACFEQVDSVPIQGAVEAASTRKC